MKKTIIFLLLFVSILFLFSSSFLLKAGQKKNNKKEIEKDFYDYLRENPDNIPVDEINIEDIYRK